MYRKNYPNDPGMHNSSFAKSSSKKANPIFRNNFKSMWEELRSRWLSVTCISLFLAVIIGGFIWNERRSIKVSRALEESLSSIRKLTSADVIFEENNNKLVHLIGRLGTERDLSAPDYGVSVNAVKLRQRLYMFQWMEDESGEVEGSDISKPAATYSYYKTWVDHLVDSDQFHVKNIYENPKQIPEIESIEIAQEVKLGNFILCKELIDKIDDYKPITGHVRPQATDIKLHAGYYYHIEDVWKPQIGDFRVEFAVAGMAGEHSEIMSVIAKQEGKMLKPFLTESGDEILIFKFGRKHPENMIHLELSQNKIAIWLFRVTSYLALLVGVSRLTSVLNSMVHINPCLRDILNMGTTHFSMCLTWSIYTFILGVLWLKYRLLFSSGFFIASVLPVLGTMVKMYLKDKNENVRNHAA